MSSRWPSSTPAEAAALGPVLRAAVRRAVERVVRPERVYVASYGERVRHVHFFLLPRTTSLPAGHVLRRLPPGAQPAPKVGRGPHPAAGPRGPAPRPGRRAWKTLSI